MFVLMAAILAVCISGVLYARKLQMDARYISMKLEEIHMEQEI